LLGLLDASLVQLLAGLALGLALRASWAAAISPSTWTTGRRMTWPPSRAIAVSITSGLCSVTWARTAVRVG
jgi:hypothetical protein